MIIIVIHLYIIITLLQIYNMVYWGWFEYYIIFLQAYSNIHHIYDNSEAMYYVLYITPTVFFHIVFSKWDRYVKWPLQSLHNERYGVSHHRRFDCLLSRLFRRWSKKSSTLRVNGILRGEPVTGGPPSQRASNPENFPFHGVIIPTASFASVYVDILAFAE